MVTIKVPATSANIGAGFDSIGLALDLFNTIQMDFSKELSIQSVDFTQIPSGADNLVYQAAKETFLFCNEAVPNLKILQRNTIPMARGLGSSSACIVAGILGANALMNYPLSKQQMVQLATNIEGHPDNVAPALLGGFVASVMEENKVYSVKKEIDSRLEFVAFVPNFTLLTTKSREVLPKKVVYADAIYNVSRAALAMSAFCDGEISLLDIVTKDALHQQYRLPLIKKGQEIFDMAKGFGALAVYISGAGPTIMAVIEKENQKFFLQAKNWLNQQKNKENSEIAFTLHHLLAVNHGAVVK